MNNYVFPYKNVKRDSKVVIYGLGTVGKAYIEQVQQTGYCKIVAVSDRNDAVDYQGYLYVSPCDLTKCECDYVVIAIESPIISATIYEMLLGYGLAEEKIVSGYQTYSEKTSRPGTEKKKNRGRAVRVAVAFRGGLGDYVVLLSFVRKLIEIDPRIIIDLYGIKKFIDAVFEGENYVHFVYDDENIQFRLNEILIQNDVLIQLVQFPQIFFTDRERVKSLSPKLYDHLTASYNDKRVADLQGNPENHLSIYHRARLFRQNRYSFLGQGSIWGLSSEDSKLNLTDEFAGEYRELGLKDKYITFNYGASISAGGLQTKVWSRDYYEAWIKMMKREYPYIQIVQLGDRNTHAFKDADKNLIDVDLRIIKHVLANSILHVDGEGGLVHLATQLGTKCVVLFGPTPVWYYGYSQNINIVSSVCSDCCHVFPEWYTTCILGDKEPRCMCSITPETVMKCVEEYLHSKGIEKL